MMFEHTTLNIENHKMTYCRNTEIRCRPNAVMAELPTHGWFSEEQRASPSVWFECCVSVECLPSGGFCGWVMFFTCQMNKKATFLCAVVRP